MEIVLSKRARFYYYLTNVGIFVEENRNKHFNHLFKTQQAEDEVHKIQRYGIKM